MKIMLLRITLLLVGTARQKFFWDQVGTLRVWTCGLLVVFWEKCLLANPYFRMSVSFYSFYCSGKSTLHQIETIMDFTGRPNVEDIASIKSPFVVKMLENTNSPLAPRSLEDRFPDAPGDAIDLLRSLLQFNPNKRFTVEECLAHPYLSQFHSPDDEPSCPKIIKIKVDDNIKYAVSDYRTLLYEEIIKKKKKLRREQKAKLLAKRQAAAGGLLSSASTGDLHAGDDQDEDDDA